jgi:hypothetical protein
MDKVDQCIAVTPAPWRRGLLTSISLVKQPARTFLLLIASAAKQSIVPQLTKLDCFAALAMTAGQSGVDPLARNGRAA